MLASSPRSLRLAYLLAGAALLGYAGCSSGTAATTSVTHPTMIEVSPSSFLGDVPCATSGNGLRAYVATLYDTNQVGEGGAGGEGGATEFVDAPPSLGGEGGHRGEELAAADEAKQRRIVEEARARLRGAVPSDHFELPSSLPSACNASVGFGYVIPERRYEVLIEGYDVEPGALSPQALGSHQMLTNGQPAVPKWTAYCARAIPVDSTLVRADQCSPFFPLADAPAPSLSVPVGNLIGDFGCGSGEGEVATLQVTATIGGQTYEQSVDCSKDASVKLERVGVGNASIYVAAFDGLGHEWPIAGATCDASVTAGQDAVARCRQLSSVGTVRVDVPALLAEAMLSCDSKTLTSVEIELMPPSDEKPSTFILPPPDCQQTFEQGLPASEAPVSLTVAATTLEGSKRTWSCKADVLPGKLTLADCE